MNVVKAMLEAAVSVVGLVVPYLVKTHGKTKEILDILRKITDAADGPEQK